MPSNPVLVPAFGYRCHILASAAALLAASELLAQEKVHYTYLWHLEQPIYWPDQQAGGADRYERAWESIQRKNGGAVHPENNLTEIFGLADRVAAYQYRCRDAISAISIHPEAGAQISYSGGLIANIASLGAANQLGYSSNWNSWLRDARGWLNSSPDPAKRKTRCDIVLFSFHHALLPLLEESTIRKEIQLYKAVYPGTWHGASGSPLLSRGIFPSEMAFSTRLIKPFADEGIAWSFVSGEKISRACSNFPVVFGSGGVNTDPPNRADQVNPPQNDWLREQISRGCAPAEAYPYAFTPQRSRYIDPATGAAHEILVVPCSQIMGWKDGYAPIGLSDFNTLQTRNDPNRPMLVVLAHDGDNAWGGGYSYYQEATPNLANSAAGAGYVPSTVERYLADHPVPANAYVHVEDGAWVNADGDFGAPTFLNWNWPLVNASGQVDIPGGWAEDARNWAVITAAQNRVDTAEQIARSRGESIDISDILNPGASTSAAERAWHYFLASLNSGYMYYGTALDMEVKPTIACNEAVEHADAVINSPGAADTTPPTIWLPQRFPWNPGSINFGPAHGYQQRANNGDFWVYTFVHDVSGIAGGGAAVTLKYRIDDDGVRPMPAPGSPNETYAGGPGVGAWQSLAMTRRPGGFPAGNFLNSPTINFFEMPAYIADQYHVQVTGLRSVLIDYYVEAADIHGNIKRSPIQHVWIGDGSGATPGGGSVVSLTPDPAVAGQSATVAYNPAGRPLAGAAAVRAHIGFNGWTSVISPDLALTWNATTSRWEGTFTVAASATQVDLAFNNGAGTWDNNGGADWHFTATPGNPNQTGACCSAGACSATTLASCAGGAAAWTSGGVCSPNPCPQPPTGSCCISTACTTTTQAACAGTWTSGSACSPNPCLAPPINFVMDGVLDTGTTLVASNGGLWIRAALGGTGGNTLYVAAPDAGEGNDHFLFFARPPATPGALRAAPWAKAGQAAAWDLFLADENNNDYESWFDAAGASTATNVQAATGPNGGVLEGTIDLLARFGTRPAQVALALGIYGNNDGGALLSASQVPASTNGNTTLDASEYVIIDLCSLTPAGCCPADFNASGGLSVQDIFDFLAAYFANDARADFNGQGGLSVQDIFDFLAGYFAGCD